MSAQHTPGPWFPSQILDDGRWGIITAQNEIVVGVTQALTIENARLIATVPDLLEIARLLSLATDEGDDAAQGTHYIDKQGRIRCKGSFLALLEQARAAIRKVTGDTK